VADGGTIGGLTKGIAMFEDSTLCFKKNDVALLCVFLWIVTQKIIV
jgi:hypothetical protein